MTRITQMNDIPIRKTPVIEGRLLSLTDRGQIEKKAVQSEPRGHPKSRAVPTQQHKHLRPSYARICGAQMAAGIIFA